MGLRTVHVVITGLVQGVGFRAWTLRQAEARGLSGWVCNRQNGAVEAVFSGDAGTVAAMIAAAHAGPRGSRVDRVLVHDYAGAQSGPFTVRPTF